MAAGNRHRGSGIGRVMCVVMGVVMAETAGGLLAAEIMAVV
jgi:hypothetical protein